MSIYYEAATVIVFGFAVLRLAGKKVMAEMTTLEMVTVLSIGTVIGHAVTENELWKTLIVIVIFVSILIVFQILALKFPWVEKVIIGRATLVIRDGRIVERNLKKLRMTMEQLELRLRRNGISNLSDVRTATIEVDGRIGYELVESAQPLTRGQAEQLLALLKVRTPPADVDHTLFEQIRKTDG
ncbi:DUF421 domain-containing protein [Cohnella caldifontis]|uniref:DUF421 domain-containing protein n=1 Tax=Cohnella caldifontis TaxID=3027471 RepID=UPI0023EBC03D|nr:YetF domain-containing protein [Cohnella sp. YIM B05605]